MIHWQASQSRLNRQTGVLQGEQLTFHTYYWGVVHHLPGNHMHKHSFFEICYVDGGTGVYTEEGKTFLLHEGAAFCSRPGIRHQIRDVNALNLLYVAFEPVEERSGMPQFDDYVDVMMNGSIWRDNQAQAPIVQLWKALLLPSGGTGGTLPYAVLPQLIYSLLVSFPNLFGAAERLAELPASPRSSAAQLVQQAKQYIRDNLAGSLTLSEIARYLSVSERHLSRLFAAGIHESLTSTVRGERIRAAEKLLADTHIPIKEIAEQVGFSSVHYFTRTFSSVKGVPPAAYRETSQRDALSESLDDE